MNNGEMTDCLLSAIAIYLSIVRRLLLLRENPDAAIRDNGEMTDCLLSAIAIYLSIVLRLLLLRENPDRRSSR